MAQFNAWQWELDGVGGGVGRLVSSMLRKKKECKSKWELEANKI